jgi:RNA-binding protein
MDSASKTRLKGQAHSLKPVIIIGQAGLTDAVIAETEIALAHHELIKIKIRAERDERKVLMEHICASTGATLIQAIGQIAVLHRLNPKKSKPQPVKYTPRTKSRTPHRRPGLSR